MENININHIPKGQKVVIRQRPNGNTEILLRPDLENGQMIFGEWSGWLIAAALGLLILLGLAIAGDDAKVVDTDRQEQIDFDTYEANTFGD